MERRFLLRTFYTINKLTNYGETNEHFLPLFTLQVDGDEWNTYRVKIPQFLPAFDPDQMLEMYAEMVGQKAFKDGRKSLDKYSVPSIFELAIKSMIKETPVVDITTLVGDFVPAMLQDTNKAMVIRRWGRTWIYVHGNALQLMTYAPDLFKS